MLPKSVSFFVRFLTAGLRELSLLSRSLSLSLLSIIVVFFPLNTTASLLSFSRFALLCFFFFQRRTSTLLSFFSSHGAFVARVVTACEL